jgi:DNA helicase HerA-like ATPase
MPEVIVGRDESDIRKYGSEGTIPIGKHMVGMGEDTHLTTPVMLDVLRPHILMICGKRGEGKSYSMSVIVEELTKLPGRIKNNLCCLMIDTQGIFWTMKTPNEKELVQLNEWGIKPAAFELSVYVPEGQEKIFATAGVNFDDVFSVQASELTAEDWIGVFGLEPNETLGIILQKVFEGLDGVYTIDHIIDKIKSQEGFVNEKLALENMFIAAKGWGIFGTSRMPEILQPGKVTVIDVSLTPQNVRALLTAIISRKVFIERVKARREEELAETEMTRLKRRPMPWIFIDEAHNFLPQDGRTAATDILNTIVKEGRQPGITLVFATQRPEKLHQDALAQCDMIISHRLTAKNDIESLNSIMQSYMLYDVGKYVSELPKLKGAAIILDDNSERIYKVMIRPRQSWHAGSSPVAV